MREVWDEALSQAEAFSECTPENQPPRFVAFWHAEEAFAERDLDDPGTRAELKATLHRIIVAYSKR